MKNTLKRISALLLAITLLFSCASCNKDSGKNDLSNLKEVFDADFERIEKPASASNSVIDVYKAIKNGELVGHAVIVSVQGYSSEIELTVGVDKDGKVTKAIVTNENESHGKKEMANYADKFNGLSESQAASIDLFSGATVTSSTIKEAIVIAIKCVSAIGQEESLIYPEITREEQEVSSLAKNLVGEELVLTNVTPSGLSYVKRIYEAGNEGYVAYTVVMTRYGTVETETLIYVGLDGKIKNYEKLVWKTSDAVYGYVPPTYETVDEFYSKLIGKNAGELGAFGTYDLVSGATSTSTNLCDALVEALTAIEKIIATGK